MSELSSGPVVSGQSYVVDEVHGHAPRTLEDFAGETSFHVTHGGHVHEVVGIGRVLDGHARVHEKMGGAGGKDVRVWSVSRTAQGFAAEHAAP
ncbi:hypothetical protein [Kineococcus indalonis]|uniref:hypothetical protein n=1 Tax=Kineococcus indalonis TaxID=2696566 RepID=UPI0014124C82|nr:hypothetical protein [Kineococcus indalonis]NAZ87099.1 hypothetical protein [Kineococcus indalonis]